MRYSEIFWVGGRWGWGDRVGWGGVGWGGDDEVQEKYWF